MARYSLSSLALFALVASASAQTPPWGTGTDPYLGAGHMMASSSSETGVNTATIVPNPISVPMITDEHGSLVPVPTGISSSAVAASSSSQEGINTSTIVPNPISVPMTTDEHGSLVPVPTTSMSASGSTAASSASGSTSASASTAEPTGMSSTTLGTAVVPLSTGLTAGNSTTNSSSAPKSSSSSTGNSTVSSNPTPSGPISSSTTHQSGAEGMKAAVYGAGALAGIAAFFVLL